MGSGGTTCDVCRKRNNECSCLPERVEASAPICPWCGCEFGGRLEHLFILDCQCGVRFEVERRVIYVSSPLL